MADQTVNCPHCGVSGRVSDDSGGAYRTLSWDEPTCWKRRGHKLPRDFKPDNGDPEAQQRAREENQAAYKREVLAPEARVLGTVDAGSRVKTSCKLVATDYGLVLWNEFGYRVQQVQWSEIVGLSFQDGSRMTVTRLATFGIAAAGMKKALVLVVVQKTDGPAWELMLDGHLPTVQAAFQQAARRQPELGRLLNVAEPPKAESTRPGGEGAVNVDALVRLAQLRTDGLLTEEEFARAKAKLLGGEA